MTRVCRAAPPGEGVCGVVAEAGAEAEEGADGRVLVVAEAGAGAKRSR